MQVTITIPDELANLAEARGLTLESYVEHLLVQKVRIASAECGIGDRMVSLDRFLDRMAAHTPKVPVLSEEFLTRDSFYPDQQ